MENPPFLNVFLPFKHVNGGFPIAMFDDRKVYRFSHIMFDRRIIETQGITSAQDVSDRVELRL